MFRGILLALAFCIGPSPSQTVGGQTLWRRNADAAIDAAIREPSAEHLLDLTPYLELSLRADQLEPHQREVFDRICRTILSTPDYVGVFRSEISRLVDEETRSRQKGEPTTNPGDSRERLFMRLDALRSPHIASLLGEYLDDETDPWKGFPKPNDGSNPRPNWVLACVALTRMKIEGAPIHEEPLTPSKQETARAAWIDWRDRVCSGVQSFRFDGDPREYNFSGPVRRQATRSRPASQAAPDEAEAERTTAPAFPWIPLVISLIFLATAGGWFLRNRRT